MVKEYGSQGVIYGPGGHGDNCLCFICNKGARTFTRDIFGPYVPPQYDFFFQLDMAGTKRTDISVKLQGSQLKIVYTTRLGEQKVSSHIIGDKYYEQDKITCTYENGLLTIKVPVKKVKIEELPLEPEIEIEIK